MTDPLHPDRFGGTPREPDRVLDESLLLDRAADFALYGDPFTLAELDRAEALALDLAGEAESLERIAAMLAAETPNAPDASRRDIPTKMPESVGARLHALASALHNVPSSAPARVETSTPQRPRETPAPLVFSDRARRSTAEYLAWTVAAASLAVAIGSNWSLVRGALSPAPREVAVADADDAERFLQSHPRALRASWSGTDDDHVVSSVAGAAYFDPTTGEGVLVIEGLAQNDPAVEQYQLWIFDGSRDERYPVDGGVFDVTCPGRVSIPMRAALRVAEPTLFAVTVEPPGGSVVSARRIALVAKP